MALKKIFSLLFTVKHKKLKSVIIDELKTLQIIDERKMAKINNSLIK